MCGTKALHEVISIIGEDAGGSLSFCSACLCTTKVNKVKEMQYYESQEQYIIIEREREHRMMSLLL